MPSPEATPPWVLDIPGLAHLHGTRPYPKATILVLNTPSPADLVALLYESPALEQSLIIIATHDVPVIPPPPTPNAKNKVVDLKNYEDVVPTVRVLKLRETWSLDGAFGVMTALDKAAKFAASYHGQSGTTGGSTRESARVCVYHEDLTTGEFAPANDTKKTRRRTFSLFSSQPQRPSTSSAPGSTALSTVPSGTRPFDALIHCINSPGQPQGDQDREGFEKGILKRTILVTTLSAPYLAVPPEPPKYLRLPSASTSAVNLNSNFDKAGPKRLRRNTLQPPGSNEGYSGLRQDPFAEPQPVVRYSGRSHILHILPVSLISRSTSPQRASTSKAKSTQPAFDSKHRLLHGIENFLIAFAYSKGYTPAHISSSASAPSLAITSSSTSSTELKSNEKPIPFIVRAGGIRGAIRLDASTSAKATLAECTLFGYIMAGSKLLPKAWLDADDPKALVMKTYEETTNATQKPQASDLQQMQEPVHRPKKRESAPPLVGRSTAPPALAQANHPSSRAPEPSHNLGSSSHATPVKLSPPRAHDARPSARRSSTVPNTTWTPPKVDAQSRSHPPTVVSPTQISPQANPYTATPLHPQNALPPSRPPTHSHSQSLPTTTQHVSKPSPQIPPHNNLAHQSQLATAPYSLPHSQQQHGQPSAHVRPTSHSRTPSHNFTSQSSYAQPTSRSRSHSQPYGPPHPFPQRQSPPRDGPPSRPPSSQAQSRTYSYAQDEYQSHQSHYNRDTQYSSRPAQRQSMTPSPMYPRSSYATPQHAQSPPLQPYPPSSSYAAPQAQAQPQDPYPSSFTRYQTAISQAPVIPTSEAKRRGSGSKSPEGTTPNKPVASPSPAETEFHLGRNVNGYEKERTSGEQNQSRERAKERTIGGQSQSRERAKERIRERVRERARGGGIGQGPGRGRGEGRGDQLEEELDLEHVEDFRAARDYLLEAEDEIYGDHEADIYSRQIVKDRQRTRRSVSAHGDRYTSDDGYPEHGLYNNGGYGMKQSTQRPRYANGEDGTQGRHHGDTKQEPSSRLREAEAQQREQEERAEREREEAEKETRRRERKERREREKAIEREEEEKAARRRERREQREREKEQEREREREREEAEKEARRRERRELREKQREMEEEEKEARRRERRERREKEREMEERELEARRRERRDHRDHRRGGDMASENHDELEARRARREQRDKDRVYALHPMKSYEEY